MRCARGARPCVNVANPVLKRCGTRYYYPRDLTDFDSNERVVEDRQLRDSWRATCENGPTSQELIREGFEAAGDELVNATSQIQHDL